MIEKQKIRHFNLLIFPLLSVLLLILIVKSNLPLFTNHQTLMYTYLQSVREGKLGYGINRYYNNMISFSGLEPGDIILGSYPECAYGYYSHAGIYIGNGKVIEGFVDLGVTEQPLEHYRTYSDVCLLKVNTDQELKKKAVAYVLNQKGKMFYPAAFKPGRRFFNCTKIIWQAYYFNGLDLDYNNDLWISPDIFLNSSYVSILRQKGC